MYPYLLRGLIIDRPNQVWCADITYIPMAKGFIYLVAVGAAGAFRHIDPLRGPMDWFSRPVLSWRLSITAEILGRQAAHRHLARGCSLIEIAAVLAGAALLLGALLPAGQWPWFLHIIPAK